MEDTGMMNRKRRRALARWQAQQLLIARRKRKIVALKAVAATLLVGFAVFVQLQS